MSIFYECRRCTACCRWPGQVCLTDTEVAHLAAFKGVGQVEFIQAYTRLRQDRRGLALEEKPNGECIFLEHGDCLVQAVKPQQCRDFPNRWNFPGFEKVCRAGAEARRAKAEGWTPPSPKSEVTRENGGRLWQT